MILAGVKAVTLHDTTACELSDLGAQFYLTAADVGTNRAAACAAKLQELNPAVLVTVVTDEISDELCAKHQVSHQQRTPLFSFHTPRRPRKTWAPPRSSRLFFWMTFNTRHAISRC